MAKNETKAKEKKIKRVEINRYRRIALYLNPVIMVVLIACVFFHAPMEAIIAVGVTGYAIFFYFLVKANLHDRRVHGAK